MSDQSYLSPVGVEVKAPQEPSTEPPDLPDREEFPPAIITATSGSGWALGASYAVQRVVDKSSPDYGKPKPNATPRVDGYIAPCVDGALSGSPQNRFGIRGALKVSPDLIEAILDHPDEARELAEFLREHQA